MNISFQLPWPDKRLNPNQRISRFKIADAKKTDRKAAFALSRLAFGVDKHTIKKIDVTFHQPDNRRRDFDNMIAAYKATQDGIADAIGLDDHLWPVSYHRGCKSDQGGHIWVDIEVTK